MGKLTAVPGKTKPAKASDAGMKQNTLDSFLHRPNKSWNGPSDLAKDPVKSITVLSTSCFQREDLVKSLLRDVLNAEGAKRLLLELITKATEDQSAASHDGGGPIDARRLPLSATTSHASLSKSTTFEDLESTVSQIKARRRKYSYMDVAQILKLASMFSHVTGAVRVINKLLGYENVTTTMITRWRRRFKEGGEGMKSNSNKTRKFMGRPVDRQFEQEVWDECIFSYVNDKKESVILANCAYSYEVIRQCAKIVQGRTYKATTTRDGVYVKKWMENTKTKDLKFSNKWIWRALRRKKLSRRRVTTSIKAEPSEQQINEHMRREIHSVVEEYGLDASHIFNADETGIRWAEGIKYQYVTKCAERAVAPPGDETGRFTAHLGSSADGEMLPLYLIVKVSCKDSTDLSKSRVLRNFLTEDGPCKPSEGWQQGLFSKEHPHPTQGRYIDNTNND